MDSSIAIAVVGAIPATIAALAAYRNARAINSKADDIKAQLTPSNGVPTAEIVEQVKEELSEHLETTKAVKEELEEHRAETRRHRDALLADVRAVKDDVQYHITVQHGRGPTEDQT